MFIYFLKPEQFWYNTCCWCWCRTCTVPSYRLRFALPWVVLTAVLIVSFWLKSRWMLIMWAHAYLDDVPYITVSIIQ